MGGKGSGGNRLGAGRPKAAHSVRSRREARSLVRQSGADLPAVPPAPAPVLAVVARPPALTGGQQALWAALAPHAEAAGTLTGATALSFQLLIMNIDLANQMAAQIAAEGLTGSSLSTRMDADGGGEQVFEAKAHPLLGKYTALLIRIENGLARFRLNATGKEQPPAPVSTNPWDQVA